MASQQQSEGTSNRTMNDPQVHIPAGKDERNAASEPETAAQENVVAAPEEHSMEEGGARRECSDDCMHDENSNVVAGLYDNRLVYYGIRLERPVREIDIRGGSQKAFYEVSHPAYDYTDRKVRTDSFRKATPDDDEFFRKCSLDDQGQLTCSGCGECKCIHHDQCHFKDGFADDNIWADRDAAKVFSWPPLQTVNRANLVVFQEVPDMSSTVKSLVDAGCFYTEDSHIKCNWCLKASQLRFENCNCPRRKSRREDDHRCDNPATNG